MHLQSPAPREPSQILRTRPRYTHYNHLHNIVAISLATLHSVSAHFIVAGCNGWSAGAMQRGVMFMTSKGPAGFEIRPRVHSNRPGLPVLRDPQIKDSFTSSYILCLVKCFMQRTLRSLYPQADLAASKVMTIMLWKCSITITAQKQAIPSIP